MARQERKYHYIYKITCKITNRYYIGMHSTDDLNDGYFGSGKRLWFSINYHGKENHVKEILEFLPTRQLLKEREKEIVNKELIGDVLCMNLKEGGEGGFVNEEHRQNFHKGTSKYYKKKWADKKYREQNLKCLQQGFENAKKNGCLLGRQNFKSKKHSDESKKLMSEKAKKRTGEKNSQYGTCWITKDGLNKKIKKEELNKWIIGGWVQGRK